MRISTKTRYGMRFMVDLAQHYGQGSIPMKDIAARQNISKKYLEQVVSPLNSAGLLEVTRGQRGGFKLSRPPEEISLADVMSASEDGLDLMECLTGISFCANEDGCIAHNIWGGLQDAINGYLENRSLADVIGSCATDIQCPEKA